MYEDNIKYIKEAQTGNEEMFTKLIEINNGLIWSIVKRFQGRGFENDDLYQIAVLGMIKAIHRFDINFEVKFSTYAVPYIIGELKRTIRDNGKIKISRGIKELSIKIKELQKQYLVKGKEITLAEIEKELKVKKEEIILAMDSLNSIESIYKNNDNSDDGITILDGLSNKRNEEEEIVNSIIIKDLLEKLEKREKIIIIMRYFKGKTQSEVAQFLNITQVQVSRVEKRILEKMKDKLVI